MVCYYLKMFIYILVKGVIVRTGWNCSLVSLPQSQTTHSSVCVCLTMAVCYLDCHSKSTRPTSYTHKERIKVHCVCPVFSSTITDFPFDFQDDKYNRGSHGNSMGWCSLQSPPLSTSKPCKFPPYVLPCLFDDLPLNEVLVLDWIFIPYMVILEIAYSIGKVWVQKLGFQSTPWWTLCSDSRLEPSLKISFLN